MLLPWEIIKEGLKFQSNGGRMYSGGINPDLQLFANKNIAKMSSRELAKSISSWEKEVPLHKDKILNPSKYYPDWNRFDERYKQGLMKHWNHEIQTFEQDVSDAKNELKRRGE